jgi:hypothetical protein
MFKVGLLKEATSNMFRRKDTSLPKDPHWPADLKELGLERNEKGQFVKIKDRSSNDAEAVQSKTPTFFDFFHTNSDRSNEVRREAFHECVKQEILKELANLGVGKLFLHGDDFAEMKPEGPHVAILSTKLDALRRQKDVVIVVNEPTQDLGVWAYRSLTREGGLEHGSVVGLVKKLQHKVAPSTQIGSMLERLKLEELGETSSCPGIIILNPGELLYSNELHKNMSQKAWLARPKKNALESDIKIDNKHNRVPGHENHDAHIRTVLERVVTKIVNKDARLFIVGMSNGAESMMKYYDEKYDALGAANEKAFAGAPHAVALMESTHSHDQLSSEEFKNFLKTPYCAKSYIVDERPKGTFLTQPGDEAQETRDRQRSVEDIRETAITARVREDSTMSSSTMAAPVAISTSPPHQNGGVASNGHQYPASNRTAGASTCNANTRNGDLAHSSELGSSYGKMEHLASAHDLSNPSRPSLDQSLDQSLPSLADSTTSISQFIPNLTQSNISIEHFQWEGGEVSCPTFSSGVPDHHELIWPEVMDDVLGWFEWMSEQDERRTWDRSVGVGRRGGA